MRDRNPSVLFVAAAGPRRGYGHLIRCGVLADALGASRQLLLRGSTSTLHRALALGWTVHRGPRVLAHLQPDLLIIDDPSPAIVAAWVRRARRLQIPVATIHDGRSHDATADLVIDGSVLARADRRANRLAGPTFAILRPAGLSRRATPPPRARRILVALGGGSHIRQVGVAVARAIADAVSDAQVDLAAGFAIDGALPRLPLNCRWVSAPAGLGTRLASVDVAVVAGGVTLYEACAAGVPTVALPVVTAQRPAIRAAARAGAVVGLIDSSGRLPARVAATVSSLLTQPLRAARLRRRARRLVDGHGTARVVARLRALMLAPRAERWRHAA